MVWLGTPGSEIIWDLGPVKVIWGHGHTGEYTSPRSWCGLLTSGYVGTLRPESNQGYRGPLSGWKNLRPSFRRGYGLVEDTWIRNLSRGVYVRGYGERRSLGRGSGWWYLMSWPGRTHLGLRSVQSHLGPSDNYYF